LPQVKGNKNIVKVADAMTENYLKKHMNKIVKIQSIYRGYMARKYLSLLRSKNVGSSKYFTYEESKETISKMKKYDPGQKRERRQPYQFKTGAVYAGEWKGGFRDG
jgi:IQ calmodulin-binding motif